MGIVKKTAIGFGIAAAGICTLAAADGYLTRQAVRGDILNDFAAVTGSSEHAFYGCVANRAAPAVASALTLEKYQRWKESYAPFLPVTFDDDKEGHKMRMIFGDEGRYVMLRFTEAAKHVEPCLTAHGVPVDADVKDIRRFFQVTNGMGLHFDN